VTPWGWIVLLLSVGTVTALFTGCLWMVLTSPGEAERMRSFGVEPPDVRDTEDPRG